MAKYKNIDEYRKKKKMRQIALKLLLVAVIFVILFVLLNFLDVFKGSRLDEIITGGVQTGDGNFPLYIKNEQLLNLDTMGNNMAVLTKSNLLTYSLTGKKVNSVRHSYTNPVTKEGNRRTVTYDRGGYKLRVDSSSGLISEITTVGSILCAETSNDGSIAVMTEQDRRSSYSLIVYDSNLKERYKFSAASEGKAAISFSCAAFSNNSNHLAACALTTIDGVLSAFLYEFDLTKDTPAQITSIPDILPLGVSYKNNGDITVVGKDSTVTVKKSTKTITRYEYQGDLQHFSSGIKNHTVLVNHNLFNNYSVVSLLNEDGKTVTSVDIEDDILDIYCNGNRILLLGKKAVYNYNLSFLLLNQINLTRSFQKIISNGGYCFVMGTDDIEKYKID